MNQPAGTNAAPNPPPASADDKVRRVELLISVLLRAGVIVSLVLILSGMALAFFHHPVYASSPVEKVRLTSPGAVFPRTLTQVVEGMQRFSGRAFVVAGLLVLIATPVMRVAVSVVGFIYQRDRAYIVITSIVLALLLLSFMLGKVEHGSLSPARQQPAATREPPASAGAHG